MRELCYIYNFDGILFRKKTLPGVLIKMEAPNFCFLFAEYHLRTRENCKEPRNRVTKLNTFCNFQKITRGWTSNFQIVFYLCKGQSVERETPFYWKIKNQIKKRFVDKNGTARITKFRKLYRETAPYLLRQFQRREIPKITYLSRTSYLQSPSTYDR